MDMLAEANRQSEGRWLLVPRKEERFLGLRDRRRVRVRQRRKLVLTVLLEATALTLLIGLFPPLRAMLLATAALFLMLLGYVGLLVQLRIRELQRARLRRARRAIDVARFDRVSAHSLQHAAGKRNGHPVAGGHPVGGHAAANGNGNRHGNGRTGPLADGRYADPGVRAVDDDVHVVVRQFSEVDPEELDQLAR